MTLPTCYTPCQVSLSDKSADDRFYKERLPNLLLKRCLLYRHYVRTEIAHAAAHVKYHFRRGRTQHIHHVPAHFMRGEELSHLGLLLRFGVIVVIGKIGLPEVVQTSDAGIAVIDALRRNEVLAGVYGEEYLLVDFGTHTLRYLLGDDGIHGFICLSLKMKTPRKDRLTGCCVNLIMVSFLLG